MGQTARPLAVVAVLLVLGSATAARGDDLKPLQVGDAAPDFECRDDQGQLWRSRDHVGKKTIVLYFYPGDFNFCCTRQAVRFGDHVNRLAEHDAEVIGVSGDAVATHRAFKATHALPFTLLSDEDGRVAQSFGVPVRAGGKAVVRDRVGNPLVGEDGRSVQESRRVTVARRTFVIDKNGNVVHGDPQISPVKDAEAILDFLGRRND